MKFNFSHSISQRIATSLIMLLTFMVQDVIAETQPNPGWALDRIDGTMDATYTYNKTGRGSVIYVFDSGLNLNNTAVRNEFTDSTTGALRASIFYDFNYPFDQMGGNPGNDDYGKPCSNHGTMVSAIAAGNKYGVAKDATIRMVKVADKGACNGFKTVWIKTALEWLDQNFDNGEIIKAGDIINMSMGFYSNTNCTNSNNLSDIEAIEDAMEGLRSKGIIIVTSAGNNGCDPSKLPAYRTDASFLVGGTWVRRLAGSTADGGPLSKSVSWMGEYITQEGLDEVAYNIESYPDSPIELGELDYNVGDAIDAYAPAHAVDTMRSNGQPARAAGTSYSAPLVAGIFAIACEVYRSTCQDPSTDIYTLIKTVAGQKGNVVTKDYDYKVLNSDSDKAVFLEQLW